MTPPAEAAAYFAPALLLCLHAADAIMMATPYAAIALLC